MSDFIGSVWWLIVALGVLITFHELGHYWVARRCGVKVLRFSVGFGKPLWMRRDRHGTEWAVAAIPLGGYVRMLGEHELADRKAEVSAEERNQSHDSKPVLQRMAISAAGPIANLILCVVLLWVMFVLGRPDYAPVVGQTRGLAAEAGLQPGDTLLAVGEQPTPTWTEAVMALLTTSIDRKPVDVRVRTTDGTETVRSIDFSKIPGEADLATAGKSIGLIPRHQLPTTVVGKVNRDAPAYGLLETGDQLISIDGQAVSHWDQIGPAVASAGKRGSAASVSVIRDGRQLTVDIKPRLHLDPKAQPGANTSTWILGIIHKDAPKDAVLRYGPLEAVPAAFAETASQTRMLFNLIGKVLTGKLALRDSVAGPITIARTANATAKHGVSWFIGMLAALSLTLGIMNLLPIPVLDGGHLLYYLIELVKGSPLSERAMVAGQYVGIALLLGLMGLAFHNDILGLMR